MEHKAWPCQDSRRETPGLRWCSTRFLWGEARGEEGIRITLYVPSSSPSSLPAAGQGGNTKQIPYTRLTRGMGAGGQHGITMDPGCFLSSFKEMQKVREVEKYSQEWFGPAQYYLVKRHGLTLAEMTSRNKASMALQVDFGNALPSSTGCSHAFISQILGHIWMLYSWS